MQKVMLVFVFIFMFPVVIVEYKELFKYLRENKKNKEEDYIKSLVVDDKTKIDESYDKDIWG